MKGMRICEDHTLSGQEIMKGMRICEDHTLSG